MLISLIHKKNLHNKVMYKQVRKLFVRLAISLINLDDFEIHNIKFYFSLTSTKQGFFLSKLKV